MNVDLSMWNAILCDLFLTDTSRSPSDLYTVGSRTRMRKHREYCKLTHQCALYTNPEFRESVVLDSVPSDTLSQVFHEYAIRKLRRPHSSDFIDAKIHTHTIVYL